MGLEENRDLMDVDCADSTFLPYERQLRAWEPRRRPLGAKVVDRPTYERHITGPIERFDGRKNACMTLVPTNLFGEEFRCF
jgi:hypothetical protein